jgi:eukaryotic-like serine/threonine-protein kinase
LSSSPPRDASRTSRDHIVDPPGSTWRARRGRRRRVLSSRRAIAWLVATLVAGAAAAAFVAWGVARSEPDDDATMRLPIPMPADFTPSRRGEPAPSPDGRHVVVASAPTNDEPGRLWLRHLDSLAFEPLAGTEGAVRAFWSPDSRSLAFVANRRLMRLGIHGGRLQPVASLDGETWGGTWNDEDMIVLSTGSAERAGSTLVTVPAAGGRPRPLTRLDATRDEMGHYGPQFLPDGRRIVFVVETASPQHSGIHVVAVDAPDQRQVLQTGVTGGCVTRGHLLFLRGTTLLAQPFDVERLRLGGEPFAVASGVAPGTFGLGLFACSTSGEVVYWPVHTHRAQLAWVDRTGATLARVGNPRAYRAIALSPDEAHAAVELPAGEGQYALWVVDLASGVATRLTPDSVEAIAPVWAPDGLAITFGSRRTDARAIYRKGISGRTPPRLLLQRTEDLAPAAWTPDGRTLLFHAHHRGATVGYRWRPDAGLPPEPLASSEGTEGLQVSPDGGWLAYTSRQSGGHDVYVRPFDRTEGRVRVSTGGGVQPKWRGDGRELYYLAPDGTLMAVRIRGSAEPAVSSPRKLFTLAGEWRPDEHVYAPSRDGQRFLVPVPPTPPASVSLQMLVNWDPSR